MQEGDIKFEKLIIKSSIGAASLVCRIRRDRKSTLKCANVTLLFYK